MKPLVLDPRSKLGMMAVATFLLMIFHQWTSLAISFVLLMLIIFLLRMILPWLHFLKGLGFAVLTFFVIAWFAFDFSIALESGLRLLGIGTVFFIFFQTTPPEALSNALLKMGVPYPFTFVLSVSMQFVPVLIRKLKNIRDAQRARGLSIEGGLGNIIHLPALAGPLLIQAFRFADELAEAMEARGFGVKDRRLRHEPHFRWVDWVAMAISLAALTAVLWMRFR